MQIRNKRVLKQIQPIVNAIKNGNLTVEYGATNLSNKPFKGLNALMLGYKANIYKLPNSWALPTELAICSYSLVEKPRFTLFGSFFKKCQKGRDINAPVVSSNSTDIYNIRRYPTLHNVLDIIGFEYATACKYSIEFSSKFNLATADDFFNLVSQECSDVPEQFQKITESIVFAYLTNYCRVQYTYPSIDSSVEEIFINLEVASKYAYRIASSLIELSIPDSKDLARQHLSNIASLLKG